MAAGAVYALAIVFSVQQGEHGPLVVYKLQAPKPAAPAAATTPAPAYADPSRAPRVLGTVLLPLDTAPPPTQSFSGVVLRVPEPGLDFRVVEDGVAGQAMINEETGTPLTLEQISDAIAWRRDTAEKLRRIPIAPRF